MHPRLPRSILLGIACLAAAPRLAAADEPGYTHREDVIYGRKYGTALTMDVFRPKQGATGAAVVLVVSGGFVSSHESINPLFALPLVNRGYTVFTVVHGSQPRYTVVEIVQDMNRAVRFIRHKAAEFQVDPDRIGVTGASAGGHLSLMLGTAGDQGDPNAKDPVQRQSSRVQAVACFFPPTDFLNYGKAGEEKIRATDHAKPFRPAFDYRERDEMNNLWVSITDPEKLRKIARDVSPIYHASADDAPTLILHGDADPLVPLQQSETMIETLKQAGVEAKLVVKKGGAHGWLGIATDIGQFVDWFDAHLIKKATGDQADPKPTCANPGDLETDALPEPWSHRDIGEVAVAGDASRQADGSFRLSGTLDIWGKADGFHFAYRPLDGDGEIVARVLTVENTNNHAKGGVMIRESLAPGARHATMVVTPVDGTQFLRRKGADAVTTNTNPGRNRGKLPCWVKLVRKGDLFQAFESTDGRDWAFAGEDTVPMPATAFIGLVASSHQKSVTNTSTLDRVEVRPH